MQLNYKILITILYDKSVTTTLINTESTFTFYVESTIYQRVKFYNNPSLVK